MTPFQSLYFDDQPREGRIVDIFHAANPTRDIALFCVHGGGWGGGSRNIYHSIIHGYRQLGFDCASTDYRLSGVNVEKQVGDIRIGLALFLQSLAGRKRPLKVVFMGSSAGAHLALLTALSNENEYGRPDLPVQVPYETAGIVVQAAPFTFELWDEIFPGSERAIRRAMAVPYEGNEELYRKASPMSYIREGMPPIFALHAENEHMFPLGIAHEFASRATALGNVVREKTYPRTEHGFFYALERRPQQQAFEDILEFIKSLED